MKNFRRLCFAMVLTLAFMVPAWAGDISSPAATDPAPGEQHTPGAPAPGDMNDPPAPAPGQDSDLTAPGDIGTPFGAAILFAIQCVLG